MLSVAKRAIDHKAVKWVSAYLPEYKVAHNLQEPPGSPGRQTKYSLTARVSLYALLLLPAANEVAKQWETELNIRYGGSRSTSIFAASPRKLSVATPSYLAPSVAEWLSQQPQVHWVS